MDTAIEGADGGAGIGRKAVPTGPPTIPCSVGDFCSKVPGYQYLRSGSMSEYGGVVPHWRGIYDDNGRIMVAICFDMDLGDSWEHADDPEYEEEFSALGIRIGANYTVYSMTH